MTPAEWTLIAARIHMLYGGVLEPEWAEGWYPSVAEFSSATVLKALEIHARGPGGAFKPNGGQLAAICGDLTGTSGRDFDDVWEEIQRLVRKVGYWEQPDMSPEARALVRFLSGWEAVCALETDDLPTVRAQARMAWSDIAKRIKVEEERRRLEGPEQPQIGDGS
jgi:hypothetical protein